MIYVTPRVVNNCNNDCRNAMSESKKALRFHLTCKDDFDVKTNKTTSKWNPYATVRLWRPSTLNTSAACAKDGHSNFEELCSVIRGNGVTTPRTDNWYPTTVSTNINPGTKTSPGFLLQQSVGHANPSCYTVALNTEKPSTNSSTKTYPIVSKNFECVNSFKNMQATRNSTPPDIVSTVEESFMSPSSNGIVVSNTAKSVSQSSLTYFNRDNGDKFETNFVTSTKKGCSSISETPKQIVNAFTENGLKSVIGDSTNSMNVVLSTRYDIGSLDNASTDIDFMLTNIRFTMAELKSTSTVVSCGMAQFQKNQQELLHQLMQLHRDVRALVTAAGTALFFHNLDTYVCGVMHSLARLLLCSQTTMRSMFCVHQVKKLGTETIRVSVALKSTLNVCSSAVSRPTSEQHKLYLKRQASNMAALLKSLQDVIKSLQQPQCS